MKRSSRRTPPPAPQRFSFFSRVKEYFTPHARMQFVLIFLFTASVLSLLALLGLAGRAGELIAAGIGLAVGDLGFAVPAALFMLGLVVLRAFVKKEVFPVHWIQWTGLLFVTLSLTALRHFSSPLDQQLDVALHGRGGGIAGFFLAYSLQSVLGFWGGLIITCAIFLSAALLVSSASLSVAIGMIRDGIQGIGNWFFLLIDGVRSAFHSHNVPPSAVGVSQEHEEEHDETSPEFSSKLLSGDESSAPSEGDPQQHKGDFSTQVVMEVLKPLKRKHTIQLALSLLNNKVYQPTSGDIKTNLVIVQKTLENFGISVEMGEVNVGPTVTQFTLKPAEGIKLASITALHNDLALALAAHPIRIEAPIPGRSLVGIEVPNQKTALVTLRELLESDDFKKRKDNLSIVLGKNVAGKTSFASIASMPHLLIAGSTGSGKTVCINTIITSLLFQNGPEDLRFIMVDPKRVELQSYNDIPHLLTPVITDVKKAVNALRWTIGEMERRFDVLSKARKRDLISYNKSGAEPLPYIVVIIDELADIMQTVGTEAEGLIIRLAQMARAVGIHLVLATQRPSVDVITGLIKANITSRIAFAVASQMDSRTILDTSGAEKLVGRGDMLYISSELSKPTRLQGAYVSDDEIERVVTFLKESGQPSYQDVTIKQNGGSVSGGDGFGNDDDDDLLASAREVVIQARKASASLLQRRLRVGYARAARLLDLLEAQGIIGPGEGAKPREVYVHSPEEMDMLPTAEEEDGQDELA